MTTDHYTIQQYSFDLGFGEKSKVHVLQNLFSKVFYEQAMPVMETTFKQVIPVDRLVQWDRVEVNIGPLPFESVEKDFAVKFKEALEKELRLLLALQPETTMQTHTTEIGFLAGAGISLLEYFLMTGSLPWWASQQTTSDPVRVMDQLLQQAASSLRQLLLRAGRYDYVRRRLVYQFPESTVRAVINIFQPEEAVFIFSYHHDIVRVQQQQKIVKSETREVERAAWIFILDYLLKEHGNYFNRKAFVRYTLRQMALHFNLPYRQMLGLFAAALPKNEPVAQPVDPLPWIIRELAHEQEKETDTPAQLQQHLDVIRYYLLFGSLPAWALHIDRKGLVQLIEQTMGQVPASVKTLIAALASHTLVRERMAELLDDVVMHKVIRLEEPAEADFIFRYVAHLQVQQHKRSLVKTESAEFRRSVWQFILAYLYTEKGSVFNSRMFLKSHIQHMAQHYSMAYGQMLLFMVQSMGEEMQAADDSSLFHLLATLLQDYQQEQKGTLADAGVGHRFINTLQERDQEENNAGRAIVLRDLLIYWLSHDHFPWWDTKHSHRSPESLWTELVQAAPQYAQWLLQFAGEQDARARRLVYHLRVEMILPVFRSMDHAGRLIQAYTDLITVFELAMPGQIRNSQAVQAELLLLTWQSWRSGYYTSLNARSLITKSIAWLTGKMGVSANSLIQAVIHTIDQSGETSIPFAFREALHTVQGEMTTYNQLYVDGYLPEIEMGVAEAIEAGHKSSKDMLDAIIRHITEEPVKQWLRTSLQSVAITHFIVQHYQAEKVFFFIEQLYPHQAKEAIPFLQAVEKLLLIFITDTLQRDRLQLLLREFSLNYLATGRSIQDHAEFFAGWIRFITFTQPALLVSLHITLNNNRNVIQGMTADHFPFLKTLQHQVETHGMQQKKQPGLQEVLQASWLQVFEQLTGLDPVKQAKEELDRITRELAIKKQQAAEEQQQELKKRLNADNAKLYIQNAGLVLLHPLLNTLFTRLQLMEKNIFSTEAAQHRAVHLLQFLVYGQEQFPEHTLSLNKLLCGMALEDPLPVDILLTTHEKKVGEELLRVVLQRWEKLNNTSIEGLRVSFLQREGALISTPEHWTLRVEQRGIDVLLPFLPWSFGMIKAPWMKKTLFVEWT
jgi:hypothetical protein